MADFEDMTFEAWCAAWPDDHISLDPRNRHLPPISRERFDALPPEQRAAYIHAGGSVSNAAKGQA